jgi:predicted P-loop ATPase
VIEILTKDAEWVGLFAFDEFRGSPMLMERPPWRLPCPEPWEPREVTDEDCSEANNWLQRTYEFFPHTTLVAEAINTVSRRHSYHEIRDYLNRLTWDGKPRLDTWLITYCHADDGPYTRAVGRKMLLSAVARVMEPGCKADAMLILIGEQGWLKSFVFRVLASDRWFSDTYIDLRSKDAYQVLKGKWLVEFQEMTTMHDSDINRLKGYVSSQSDNYRDSYGRLSRTHPRQIIFCGTSNREDLFKDETGNRRFLPVKVHARCNIEALQRDRDQVWAEALYYYRQGEQWYLDEQMEKMAAAVQDQFLDTGAWEDKIMKFLKEREFYRITADYLLEHAIRAPAFQWTSVHYRVIALIMRKQGWQGPKHIVEEPERWVYQSAAPFPPSKGRVKGYEDPQRRFVNRKSGQAAQRAADIYLDLQDITDTDHTHFNGGSTTGSIITPSQMVVCNDHATDATDTHACMKENLSLFSREEEEIGSGKRQENIVYEVPEMAVASVVSDHTCINTGGNSAPPRATAPETPEIGSIEDDRYQGNTPASAPCSHGETDAVAGEVTCTACGEVLSSNAAVIPCAMCGQTERWDDHGVPRCVTCWPPQKVSPKHKRRAK